MKNFANSKTFKYVHGFTFECVLPLELIHYEWRIAKEIWSPTRLPIYLLLAPHKQDTCE